MVPFASDLSAEVLKLRLRRRELAVPELDLRNRELQPLSVPSIYFETGQIAAVVSENFVRERQERVSHVR